jgi:methylmalonyl-CoA mutase N-terminal domain/subunit
LDRYVREIKKPLLLDSQNIIFSKFDAIFKVDDSIRQVQIDKINKLKDTRDNAKVEQLLSQLKEDAKGTVNLMPTILACAESYATLGEIADAMRDVFGEYRVS